MSKTPSSKLAKTPAGRKRAHKPPKKPRAKVISEPAQNLVVSADDPVAIDAVARVTANSIVASRVSRRRSALDRLDDPKPVTPESSLVEVSYWGFRFGVLGVYVSGRTREKMSLAIGHDTPSVLGKLINKVVKKK